MIPVDAPLIAPRGHLLVEREEMPLRRGRIYLPPNMRFSTRANEAKIVAVGQGLEGSWAVGESVYLSNAVGRALKLGVRGERTLYNVTPSLILARITGSLDQSIENRGEEPIPIPDWEFEERAAVNEGEPEALR